MVDLADYFLGLQRYAHLTIRYLSRYRGHDTIRIAIHHKLFALLGTQILNKEKTRNYAKFTLKRNKKS